MCHRDKRREESRDAPSGDHEGLHDGLTQNVLEKGCFHPSEEKGWQGLFRELALWPFTDKAGA